MHCLLLLQLILVTHACAHALPAGHVLPHSLHRRMPPPKLPPLPPRKPHGSTNPGAGKAANHALHPATGASAEIVDPITGQLISDVNPVTGSSRGGFNPMTGQLYDRQPGRMETPPLGSPTLAQDITKSPEAGLPRGRNREPAQYRKGPRRSHSPRPVGKSSVDTRDLGIAWDLYDRGGYLSRMSMNAVVNVKGGLPKGWRVNEKWPAMDIHRDLHVTYSKGKPPDEYLPEWIMFLGDPAVLGSVSLEHWTRVTVKTKGDKPRLLLDLAVYPSHRTVVFMSIPPDEALALDIFQRKFGELLYQSLRGINPEKNFKPNRFLIPDPSERSEIGTAAWKTVALEPAENGPTVLPEHTDALNPHFLEIIGSRTAAPISFMIARHPRDVAGPVNGVTVVKGPLYRLRAVLITLGPTVDMGPRRKL